MKLRKDIPMAEPFRENLRYLGREALVSAFRKEALRCTHKYGLTAEDINDVACQVAQEIDAYTDEQEAA